MQEPPGDGKPQNLLFEVGAGGHRMGVMWRLRLIVKFAGMLALAVCLGGCIPGDSRVDEEKNPHFQRGRNLVNSQDYKGAVGEFEKALESNPGSAAAHFELGWLYDTKINDSAAAIYHYQRHLQLLPDSDRGQLVRERIRGCKQELANTEFPLPDGKNLQREVDRLTAENLALKDQLAALQHQAANSPAARPHADPARVTAEGQSAPAPPAPAHPRVHIVRERETISSIAAQYGLKASAILAANPRVEPRKLRVGQSLNLP
jgi:tetratricopeptide (TPR) repeat protein